jgi:death-on-curing protein
MDGNKRTAWVAAELFLKLNEWQLVVSDAECVMTMLAVATGDLSEEEFAVWLRAHATRRVSGQG